MLIQQMWLKDHSDLQFAILVSKKQMRPWDFPMVGTCTFCNGKLGARYAGFSEGPRRACLVRESQALCDDCLRLMKDIVELEEKERGAAT